VNCSPGRRPPPRLAGAADRAGVLDASLLSAA